MRSGTSGEIVSGRVSGMTVKVYHVEFQESISLS